MSKYFISTLCLFLVSIGYAQDQSVTTQPGDSAAFTQPYGLSVGIDLSRPVLTLINDDYTGFEIVGDYRISENLYVAGELGNEKKTGTEELGNELNVNQFEIYNFTTSGSYLKLGLDLNTYENWFGMNNSIYIGGRYAASSFSQTLNRYTIFDSNRYWSPDGFVLGSDQPEEFSGLNASWLEFIFGIKAELFANIYLGISARMSYLISNKESDTFPNLWIPGFNKVTDGSKFGVSYNYTISYLIPLYRKAKKIKEDIPEVTE